MSGHDHDHHHGHEQHCDSALSEAEFAQLESLLIDRYEAGAGGMPLDVAHGFLTAVVSGPRLVLPMEWLPRVLGESATTSDADTEALVGLIMALHQDVLQDLEHAHYGPVVMYKPVAGAEPLPLPYGWCQGYVAGLQLHGEAAIEDAGNDEKAAGYLTPIASFLMYEEAQLLDPPDPDAHRAVAEELGPAAQGLYHWWRAGREPVLRPS